MGFFEGVLFERDSKDAHTLCNVTAEPDAAGSVKIQANDQDYAAAFAAYVAAKYGVDVGPECGGEHGG